MQIQEWIILISIIVGMCIIGSALIYVGVLYGREDEREAWHRLLLRDVKRDKSLRWTATISIVLDNATDQSPTVVVTAGSTKPTGIN